MFSGGGKWEVMHEEMKGYYEARADGKDREHFRLAEVFAEEKERLLALPATLPETDLVAPASVERDRLRPLRNEFAPGTEGQIRRYRLVTRAQRSRSSRATARCACSTARTSSRSTSEIGESISASKTPSIVASCSSKSVRGPARSLRTRPHGPLGHPAHRHHRRPPHTRSRRARRLRAPRTRQIAPRSTSLAEPDLDDSAIDCRVVRLGKRLAIAAALAHQTEGCARLAVAAVQADEPRRAIVGTFLPHTLRPCQEAVRRPAGRAFISRVAAPIGWARQETCPAAGVRGISGVARRRAILLACDLVSVSVDDL